MQRAAGVMFFIGWLLCGCSIENICDDPHAALIFIVALAVVILTAAGITIGDSNRRMQQLIEEASGPVPTGAHIKEYKEIIT